MLNLLNGGISEDDFFKYFDGVEYGYAIHINFPVLYSRLKTLHDFAPAVKAPQSFLYI